MQKKFLPQFSMEIIFLDVNSDLTLLSMCSGSLKISNISFKRNSKKNGKFLSKKKKQQQKYITLT